MSLSADLYNIFNQAYLMNIPDGVQARLSAIELHLATGIVNSLRTSIESGSTSSSYEGIYNGNEIVSTTSSVSTYIDSSLEIDQIIIYLTNAIRSTQTNEDFTLALCDTLDRLIDTTSITERFVIVTIDPEEVTSNESGSISGHLSPNDNTPLQESLNSMHASMQGWTNETYADAISTHLLSHIKSSKVITEFSNLMHGEGIISANI